MTFKQIAAALLCTAMAAGPALAQTTTAPAGLGTSPNGNVQTTTTRGGGSTQDVIPTARGTIGGPSTTTTSGAYNTGNRPGPAVAVAPPPTAGTTMPAMSMTNINTASAVDLDKLPQIGKARAAKIIKMRPYASTDELVSKKVLPMSVYNKIKTQITAS